MARDERSAPVRAPGSPSTLVLHLESPNRGGQGDSIYRTVQPCRALGQLPDVDVVAGSYLHPQVHALLLSADVVVLCDVVEADLLPVLRRRRALGRATIYEVNDDFQAPQPWNATAYLAHNAITRSLSSQLGRHAHGVQFSTPHLSERFAALHATQAVLPNALWEMPARPPKGEGLLVGWGGSLGHKDDFAALVPVMARVLARWPQVTFEVMGAELFREACASLPSGRWRHRSGGSLAHYYDFLRPLHVGLCPLQDSDFNRGRSDVKFLEYAAHGAVAVAADLPPYGTLIHRQTGLKFQRIDEVEALLGALIEEPERRVALSENARAYVARERLEARQLSARWAFIERCREEAASGAVSAAAVNVHQRERALKGLPRPFADSRARFVPLGKLESGLLEGLAAARDGDAARAVATFRAATARAPQFYLPWLYLGSVEPDANHALRALDKAAELAPDSVAVALLKADRLTQQNRIEEAKQCLHEADAVAPEMGVPAARLAELAAAQGDEAAAIALEARALSENPFFAVPHVRRALASIDARKSFSLDALEICCAHDSRFWMTRFALGRAELAAGRAQAAQTHFKVALAYAPDKAPVFAQLARAALTLGDVEEARRYVDAAKASHA